jgi:DNA-binding NarL/FixJ family response regulator
MREDDNQVISVLIVSDSHLIRSGLRRILDSEARIRVLGDMSVEKAAGTFANTINRSPDVVLIELDSRGGDALKFIDSLTNRKKDLTVLVLSDLVDHDLARKAMVLGATGIVLKMQPPAVLIAAILDLRQSDNCEPLSKVMTDFRQPQARNSKESIVDTNLAKTIDSLTVREREIVQLVSMGLKNKDIANQLHISDITVRHHLTSIFCKLEISDRQKLIILAHRNGLAELAFPNLPEAAY